MKKIRMICLILCLCPVLAGCGRGTAGVSENAGEETVSLEQAEYRFPEQYEKISDSGKVSFHCKLEVSENIKGQSIDAVNVKGLYQCDREKAWSVFGEGKEVLEKHGNPATELRVQSDYYIFADGETLGINEGVNYGSSNSRSYSRSGAFNIDNQAAFEEMEVSFKSGEECIAELKPIIDEVGYHSEEYVFSCFPLNSRILEELEEKQFQEGYLEEEKRKGSWSQEDDAYFIYAWQEYEGIPVFVEYMSIARDFAFDTPDNAPILAIYSARGLESLNIGCIYAFENGGTQIRLQPFEEIAAVVEEKFENILNDARYEVTRAKLFERVYLNEEQKYEAEPVWYFEVVENDISKSVTLVNAETGKEIYLP